MPRIARDLFGQRRIFKPRMWPGLRRAELQDQPGRSFTAMRTGLVTPSSQFARTGSRGALGAAGRREGVRRAAVGPWNAAPARTVLPARPAAIDTLFLVSLLRVILRSPRRSACRPADRGRGQRAQPPASPLEQAVQRFAQVGMLTVADDQVARSRAGRGRTAAAAPRKAAQRPPSGGVGYGVAAWAAQGQSQYWPT